MRFRFSLEKALDWIAIEEDGKKLEIARLLVKAEEMRRRREKALANVETLLSHREGAWVPFTAERVPLEAREAESAAQRIRELEGQIDDKKRELNRILLRRKGLESLKEKKRREFRLQQGRRDQKRLDDQFAILRQRRKA